MSALSVHVCVRSIFKQLLPVGRQPEVHLFCFSIIWTTSYMSSFICSDDITFLYINHSIAFLPTDDMHLHI